MYAGGKKGEVKVYGGGIIRKFEKSPPDIVCPHFWELNWAYGCPFNCAYCYLKGTFRGRVSPRYIDLKYVRQALHQFFKDGHQPSILNSGELADSLAEFHDPRSELKVNPPRIVQIADEFEGQNRHKLLLLTKSHMVDAILDKERKNTIISFSINSHEVWKRWEHRTPPPEKRLEAAEKAFYAGYEVRVRIDPIFPINGWKKEYEELVDLMFSKIYPDRITLGTPRGLKSTLKYSKDRSWKKYLSEDSAWGKKLSYKTRSELYTFIIDKLMERGYTKSRIALCKERRDIWLEVGLDPGSRPKSRYESGWEKCRCNCVW